MPVQFLSHLLIPSEQPWKATADVKVLKSSMLFCVLLAATLLVLGSPLCEIRNTNHLQPFGVPFATFRDTIFYMF